MTVELRQLVLDEHNKYRSQVARGLAVNPVIGKNAPKAARMFKMAYNCSIEKKMAAWLQGCKWGHSPKANREGLGENLWMMSPVSRNKTASIINAIASWFEELEKKGVPTANKFTMDVFNRGVGHYTQVVWQGSDRIGCGIQDCPNTPMTYVGCEYQTAGNMLNDYIYEVGDPCTTNEHCKCDGCTCSREEGLCIRPDSTPMPGQMNSQIQQGKHNRFTQPQGDGWKDSQDLMDNFFSKPLDFTWTNSKNQHQKNDFSKFSTLLGSSWKNSQNEQQQDDFFSKLGFNQMNFQNQRGNHKWTSEPQGNGFRWSYSWSS